MNIIALLTFKTGEKRQAAAGRQHYLAQEKLHVPGLVTSGLPTDCGMCRKWLSASKEEAAKLPRAALACRLCKGVLMLGPASLRQHLGSRKHLARQKRKAEDYEPVFLAIGSQVKNQTST